MDLYSLLPIVVIHLYALGTAAIVVGFLAERDWLRRLAFGLLLVSFAAHTLLLGLEIARTGIVNPERGFLIQLLAWCVALAGLAAAWKWRSDALLLVVSPVILAVFVLARLLGASIMPLPPALAGMLSAVHIACLFLSFGFLTLAFGAGVLFLMQEKSIKSKEAPSGFQKELPALSVLDKVNAVAVHAGFPLFTIGILFGFVAGRLAWGNTLADPKEWVSLIIWALFAWLYHQRLAHGWRGHKPAVLAIWIFAICVFSLTVVNTVMSTHHSFFNTLR